MCVVPSLKSFVFCTRVAWVCLVCLLLCKHEGSSPVSLKLLRGGIWACMRYSCLRLVGFWDGDYVRYYVVVNFQYTRECLYILAA